ncbi:MAG: hypothetical protein AAGA46_01675 [Cyanobacteria bacterium P01_F01_bin.13]
MSFKIRRPKIFRVTKLRFLSTPGQPTDSGLTLIEGLVAVVVIGISVAVMSPLVILSVATRVQSQRAEQAFQIAQAEVDRIKLIVDRGGNYTLNIAKTPNTIVRTADFDLPGGVTAPTKIAADYATVFSSARAIDVDNDGGEDYAVQVFRTEGSTVGTRPVAFDLGVRVYRADVIGVPGKTLGVEQASLNMTSGEGQSGSLPLATLYTSIIKSDTERSLCDYHNFINRVNSTTVSTPSEC